MERQFVKRDAKNKKLIAGGSLSPMVLDYIMDGETPRPCRHFVGREEEIIELHNNYAVLLTEMQEPGLAMSTLQKLAQIIKEYNSNHCLDYAQVQEAIGNICLITANISQAKQHFQKALRIYEDIWADEPELIEEKYKKIQELYPQAGIALAKSILLTKH